MQAPLLAGAFAVTVSVGVFWLAHFVATMGDGLNERMITVANKNAFEEEFDALTALVAETKQDREALDQFILNDEADTIDLLSEFDAIAERQQVNLSTNQLAVTETSGEYDMLSLTYTVSGSEDAVIRMIEIFESLPYHGEVESLTYARKENGETGINNVTASVALQLSIKKHD